MRIFTVDAFTNIPFTGNPAGVCILERILPDVVMLNIASEINFSETAFVINKGPIDSFSLRWFTPKQEVDLCGHATLATSKVLYNYGYIDKDVTIQFDTRSGLLTSKLIGSKIELDFPSKNIQKGNTDDIINQFVNGIPTFVGTDDDWCLIELENENLVKQLKPDFDLLKIHSQKIFIVTAKSSHSKYDFVSRCFGPALGINEDPVTGSAHCYLATYWNERIRKKVLNGFQVSSRTGIVECELKSNDRVLLRGEAIIMSELKQSWGVE